MEFEITINKGFLIFIIFPVTFLVLIKLLALWNEANKICQFNTQIEINHVSQV